MYGAREDFLGNGQGRTKAALLSGGIREAVWIGRQVLDEVGVIFIICSVKCSDVCVSACGCCVIFGHTLLHETNDMADPDSVDIFPEGHIHIYIETGGKIGILVIEMGGQVFQGNVFRKVVFDVFQDFKNGKEGILLRAFL